MALKWDRGLRAHVPYGLAKGVTGVAAVPNDPLGHALQLVERGYAVRQFMSLTGCQLEGDGVPLPVGDHTSLGVVAAT